MSYLLGKKVAKIKNYKKHLINVGFALLFAASLATGMGPLVNQAFASASSNAKTLTYNFDSYTGGSSWNHNWTFTNTGYYDDDSTCGDSANCVQMDNSSFATLNLPAGGAPTSVSFFVSPQAGSATFNGKLYVVEGIHDLGNLSSHSFSSSQLSTGTITINNLNPLDTSLQFVFSKDTGNLALDDVVVTTSNPASTPTISSSYPVKNDNDTLLGCKIQLDAVINNYDVTKPGHVAFYREGQLAWESDMVNKGGRHWQTAVDTTTLQSGPYTVLFSVPGTNISYAVEVQVNNSTACTAPASGATYTKVTNVKALTNPQYPYDVLTYANFNVSDATEELQVTNDNTVKLANIGGDNHEYIWLDGNKYSGDAVTLYYHLADGSWKKTLAQYDANGILYKLNGVLVDGYTDNIPPTTSLVVSHEANGLVNSRQHDNKLTVTGHATDNLSMSRVLVQLLTSRHGAIANHTVYLSGANQDWSTSFNTKTLGLTSGSYSVVAVVTDNAGNTSAKGQYHDFMLDNTKPVAKFTSATSNPAPNGYYNGNFTVGYSVTDNYKLSGVNVSLFDTNPANTNHYAAACHNNGNETGKDDTGTCIVKLGDLPDGKYYVKIGGIDAAGLWTVNATRTIHIDRTTPAVPTLYRPANGSVIRPGDAILNWNDVTDPNGNGPVTYQYESSFYSTTNQNGNSFTSLRYGPHSTGTVSQIDATGSSTHVYYWQVRACDAIGNCSDWSGPWQVTIDGVRPTLSDFHIDNQANVYSKQINVSATADDNYGLTGVEFFVTAPENRSGTLVCDGNANGTRIAVDGQLVNGRYVATLDTSSLTGTYCVNAQSEDTATNHSAIARKMVTIDNKAPTATLSLPNGVLYSKNVYKSIQVMGELNDNSGHFHYIVHLLDANGNEVPITQQPGALTSNTKSGKPGEVRGFTTANLKDGQYSLFIVISDTAGNSTTSNTVTFAVDSTAPDAPTLVSPKDGAVLNGASITQAWSDGSSDINHYVYESCNDVNCNSRRWGNGVNGEGIYPASQTSKTATNVGDATYWWRVKAVDNGSNESAWSQLWEITVDNSTPVVTDNFDLSMLTGEKQLLTPVVDDFNGDYTYSWTASDPNLIVPGQQTDSNDATLTIGPAPAGDYTLDLTVTDQAGNQTTVVYNVSIKKHVLGDQAPARGSTPTGTDNNKSGGSDGQLGDKGADLVASLTNDSDNPLAGSGANGNDNQKKGSVQGDQTNLNEGNKNASNSSDFLGLGWWWLPILAALVVFFAALFTRAGANNKA